MGILRVPPDFRVTALDQIAYVGVGAAEVYVRDWPGGFGQHKITHLVDVGGGSPDYG